jgi:hypothetical protein
MAVVLNFVIEQSDNAKKLIFGETTGAYDASLNTDGWGTPNEDTSDEAVSSATSLTITPPAADGSAQDPATAGTTYTGTNPKWLALINSYPTTDTGLELEITSQMLGGDTDEKHPDGVWTFKYEITTGTQTYTTEHKVFVSGSIRCCVNKKLAAIDTVDCDCDSTEKSYALQAYTFYLSLLANADCGNEDGYKDILSLTRKLCSTNKCA